VPPFSRRATPQRASTLCRGVKINFQIPYRVNYGDAIKVVGSDDR